MPESETTNGVSGLTEHPESKQMSPTTAAPGIAAPAELPQASPNLTKSPIQDLWTYAQSHGHSEIWGVELADPDTHVPSQIIFQKYLNANDGDIDKAKDQLIKTLDWRKEMKPLELLNKTFSKEKFEGLGYVTVYGDKTEGAQPEEREVFTWNVYGIVKDVNLTFGDVEEFLTWRVALMELALVQLHLPSATTPITPTFDPYKIYQVHDYATVSFLRPSPIVKSASTATIKTFAQNYPELLKEKFFLNVPAVMGFVYGVMKLFVAEKTVRKFHPMRSGMGLGGEFVDGVGASGVGKGKSRVVGVGEMLPGVYGGKGEGLEVQGMVVRTKAGE